ncbi:DUF6635 family protein [Marinobacterium jannaschii]|uniref:DUF6635 family protein n=1 Tax=Marinobacterium jannaschii TaxID=64970 RepID=UPI001FDEFAC8|nr:DUF6635 family protein [Marinobacterium jannaschii]
MTALDTNMTETGVQAITSTEIEQALQRGIRAYFAHCRAQLPGFICRHFRYPGAIATNRVALGWDMLRAPVNLFWAPLYALLCIIRFLVAKTAGRGWLWQQLGRFPAGFTTQVQQSISQRVLAELLGEGRADSSLSYFIAEELQSLYQRHDHRQLDSARFHALAEPVVMEAITQYQVTRTASADITNTLSCTVLGAFAFQKFTPGGLGIALTLAALISNELAIRSFVFGEGIGSLWYAFFPPEPSLGLTAGVAAAVMALLAAFAALSGVISDPLQAMLGLHRQRLNKLLDHMEQDFIERSSNRFRPKDQYVARVLEVFDMVKTGLM